MAYIIVKDSEGNEAVKFQAHSRESIATQIQEQDIPLVIGCGVGACSMCKGRITKGSEYINPEANGSVQFPIEEDETLTCIAGIKEETPDDAEIIIEFENL